MNSQQEEYDQSDYQWRYTFSQVHEDVIEDLSLDQNDLESDNVIQCDDNVIDPLHSMMTVDDNMFCQLALNNIVISIETNGISNTSVLS